MIRQIDLNLQQLLTSFTFIFDIIWTLVLFLDSFTARKKEFFHFVCVEISCARLNNFSKKFPFLWNFLLFLLFALGIAFHLFSYSSFLFERALCESMIFSYYWPFSDRFLPFRNKKPKEFLEFVRYWETKDSHAENFHASNRSHGKDRLEEEERLMFEASMRIKFRIILSSCRLVPGNDRHSSETRKDFLENKPRHFTLLGRNEMRPEYQEALISLKSKRKENEGERKIKASRLRWKVSSLTHHN